MYDDKNVTDITNTEKSAELMNLEYRIHCHVQGAYQNLLEVGRCLTEAKDKKIVPHGAWETWVRENTGFTERQAQKLMQAARAVPAGSAMEALPISKIQTILTLPEGEREEMAQKAKMESLTLRALQEEIRAARARETAAHKEQERISGEMAAQKKSFEEALARNATLHEAELEKARTEGARNAGAQQTEKAQKEIDSLRLQLSEAENYAEEQAAARQQAQREMLAMQQEQAHGNTASDTLDAYDIASAVRVFIGKVGVLPHMGKELAGYPHQEREVIAQYVQMVEAWVQGVSSAMGIVDIQKGV